MSDVLVRDSGGRHELSVGDALVIELEEPATTGFVWDLAPEFGPLVVVADERSAGSASDGAPGAALLRRVRLVARGHGTAHVVAHLRRPSESTAASTFDVEVTVV